MSRLGAPLPIDELLPDALAALESGTALVLQASPGSGKTTRLPAALLGARFAGRDGKVIVLEPRRLAAKYAARRVAEEHGERVGESVGYHFRFERVVGPRTRLLFLTEGMLLRRLLLDPTLEGVAAVVLDEFHERHLHTDTALAYLTRLQRGARPDLRLVVMSATLDAKAVSDYLGGCTVLTSESRQFPIDVAYLPDAAREKPLDALVRDSVGGALRADPGGHVLVFLPGMAEIRRAEAALRPSANAHGWLLFPLHGELPRDQQDMAIAPTERTKIVLATNVAETSLTIEGINTVVDSGLHRQASYSWWSGIPSLRTRPISRASAVQRAGRAGRTGPGRCFRLYGKGDFEGRAPFETPEIRRADMAQPYLELVAMGVPDPAGLPWFERPEPQAIEAARELLFRLGALGLPTPGGPLTRLGKRMAALPAHPRLARLVLEGAARGVTGDAATLAAALSEGALESLDALEGLREAAGDPAVRRVRESLLAAIEEKDDRREDRDALARAVLAGFPDRIARPRVTSAARVRSGEQELVFSSGGSARVDDSPLVRSADTFVALELQERQPRPSVRAQLWVRSLVPIAVEWLFDVQPSGVAETSGHAWDADRKRVVQAFRLTYGQLTLEEALTDARPSEDAARILLKEGLGLDPAKAAELSPHQWIEALGRVAEREELETALARVQIAAKTYGELGLPEVAAGLFPAVTRVLASHLSLAALEKIDWPESLLAELAAGHRCRIEELTPVSVNLPSGRRARIRYALDKGPWVESRLQDFFGWSEGPRVLGGRVALTLHLLAPNQRAVQVTTDLAGFWQRAYPTIRKELSRKYPRHKWPENPMEIVR